MEALTDGIFAISMTLLVLELRVPDLPKPVTSAALLHAIGTEKAAFIGFAASFAYCGVLWVLHHLAMHFVRHLQAALVWLNLLFLMMIAVLPFSCGLLGRYGSLTGAIEIYFGNLFLASALLAAQWRLARKRKLIMDNDPLAAFVMGTRIMMLPPALAAAMLTAVYRPWLGFYAMLFVMLGMRMWTRREFRRKQAATQHYIPQDLMPAPPRMPEARQPEPRARAMVIPREKIPSVKPPAPKI
jgi:uncharacterized membrane protein